MTIQNAQDAGNFIHRNKYRATRVPKKSVARFTFDGLGTTWWVELLGFATTFPKALSDQLTTMTALFDDTYSRFHDETLIGQLNVYKRLSHPPDELLEMLRYARKMHSQTDGVFDISVGGALQRLGYGDTSTAQSTVPNFWSEAKLSRDEIVIPRESAIDLGGFGKGWLLDKMARLLEQRGYPHYLINGGGDIVVSAAEPIELGLEHPYDSSKVIGTTKIQHGALAVSSTMKRRWDKDGTTYNHIIDPTDDTVTNSPIIVSYVKGETALITDTLATILLLQPESKARLEELFAVQAILLTADQLA